MTCQDTLCADAKFLLILAARSLMSSLSEWYKPSISTFISLQADFNASSCALRIPEASYLKNPATAPAARVAIALPP